MIVRVVNSDENPYAMAGTRIHDHSHQIGDKMLIS